MYETNMNKDEYNKVENFYKALGGIDSTELEVYLHYKIAIRNSSSNKYNLVVNSIEDFYDSTFKLITENENKYVKSADGKVQEGTVQVASAPYGTFSSEVTATEVEKGIKGSDGVTYNKLSIKLNNLKLTSGETAYIYADFKVEKGNFQGVQKAIALGGKSNLAEVSSYSTNYADGGVAGKIDRDSAPANINVRNHNSKNWYEDDADIAPVLNLKFAENDRTVSGIAWEDKVTEKGQKDGEAVGNGVQDKDEPLIGGLTTELVEKVTIKDGKNYQDYDFIWPTSQRLSSLGGMSLESLTGFDSVVETSKGIAHEDGTVSDVGKYTFVGAPTGDYVVRFVYGDNEANLDNTIGMIGNAVALKENGEVYYDKSNTPNTANGNNAVVYNGQDYKSTVYQAGFIGDGYISNEWHDLNNTEMNNKNISDARDSEARRLEVIANSQTITNANSEILETANDQSKSHTALYNQYYMFADTAKLNMSVENLASAQAVNGIQEKEGLCNSTGSVSVGIDTFEYEVPSIDFGLIERPKNILVLDKEISSIKLITNDGNTIFDAKYNVSYELKDIGPIDEIGERLFDITEDKVLAEYNRDGHKKQLIAVVKLDEENSIGINVLQALDKKENKLDSNAKNDNPGTQNFRFINIDDTILQGTTIEINYKLTALNVGDEDYTSKELAEISGTSIDIKAKILGFAKEAEEASHNYGTTEIGTHLGKYYYTGVHDENETVVTSKVRQIVEYVDNDGVFSPDMNTTENHAWKSTSANELSGNGYKENRLVDDKITVLNEMYDKNGRLYIDDSNHNIALSIDSEDGEEKANKEFEVKLEPVNKDENNLYKSEMNITISKVVSAESDADNLTFDNVAEIVKFENSVGRRDITAVPGNSNPKGSSDEIKGEFYSGLKERDSSATELVTFTPPTGIETENVMTSQILIAIVAALGILALGIVVIKKKILSK